MDCRFFWRSSQTSRLDQAAVEEKRLAYNPSNGLISFYIRTAIYYYFIVSGY